MRRLLTATALGFILTVNGAGLAFAGNGDDAGASTGCTDVGKDGKQISASCQVPEVPTMLVYPAVGIAVFGLYQLRSRRKGAASSLAQ